MILSIYSFFLLFLPVFSGDDEQTQLLNEIWKKVLNSNNKVETINHLISNISRNGNGTELIYSQIRVINCFLFHAINKCINSGGTETVSNVL